MVAAVMVEGRRSTSHEQNDQNDQQDGAKTAADIGAAKIEAAAAKHDQEDNNKQYQVHEFAPTGNDFGAKATSAAAGSIPLHPQHTCLFQADRPLWPNRVAKACP
jgi:hypothetical protein